jgi:starch synthase
LPISVLSVASEAYPLIKTGGLADVVGALPGALGPHGVETITLLPGYPAVMAALHEPSEIAGMGGVFGGPARLLRGTAGGLDIVAVDAPHLFARDGAPYVDAAGAEWPDNAFRFAALAKAAAQIGGGGSSLPAPQIAHLHDWQPGLAAAYLVYGGGPRPKIVSTIHNIAFAGWFPASLAPALGLPPEAMQVQGVEFYGGVGYLKSALYFADRITTVSPTYASEILRPEFGHGFEGLLGARAGALSGVLNGIDTDVWDPETDPRLAARFGRADPSPRKTNKLALAHRFGLEPNGERLLFGVVSRLSDQKGLDLLADAVPTLVGLGASLALVGAGDAALERRFGDLAAAHPGRVGCFFGYDEALARLVQGGADALLVPSRFEPCGLTQLCALRYGAIPVVARTGGLADTVIDANPMALAVGVATGVQFSPVALAPLESALRRTAAIYADSEAWAQLQRNAMATDVSWGASAETYAALYRDLLG